jgi:hypothetical protein
MKIPKEFKNGFILFIGLAAYFFLMELLGLSNNHYLRVFNIFIVYYGIHRTLQANFKNGEYGYINNLMASVFTATIGVLLSVTGLVLYIYYRGGQMYLNSLSENFLFGGKPTVTEYCFGLLFEGIASALIIVFLSMQYWQGKTKENS